MYCENCGKKLLEGSSFCNSCGESIRSVTNNEINREISATPHQPNIGKWSWGAFTMSWFYLVGLNYKYWWVFLILLVVTRGLDSGLFAEYPITGLIMAIYLGMNGRKWTWESRKWASLEDYRKTQKSWDIAGIIIYIILSIVLFFVYE